MAIEKLYKPDIGIAWWNTGLSPICGNPKIDLSKLLPTIGCLCAKADIVLLCEHEEALSVSAINEIFKQNGVARHFEGRKIVYGEGRAGFKMTLLYNSDALTFCELPLAECCFLHTDDELNSGHYRVGVLLRFKSEFLSDTLDIYAVHWSQHDECDAQAMKMSAATTLSSKIRQSSAKYVMCIGDFNVEPYEASMSVLGASRSLGYAADGKCRFYNPFWKFMPYTGTIMSASNRVSKCESPIFDQMLIGREFLGGEFCHEVKILGDEVYAPPHGEHRPIIVTFKKRGVNQNGGKA